MNRIENDVASMKKFRGELLNTVDNLRKQLKRTENAIQLAQMFKKGGRRGDDVSEAGQLLTYVLNNGPLVGVFTVLQVDNVANLQQIGDSSFACFSHRVALQMDDRDSQKIVGSEIANKLYIMNRPSSKYRAYYYNNRNRILVKFKPYKLS
jgi:hypothetical protein